jgi:hypothetical protein
LWELVSSDFLGFIRTLMSAAAFLEIRYAGGSPYKWTMNYAVEGGTESKVTGHLLFNYFGRRSTVVLQNHHLPPRYGTSVVPGFVWATPGGGGAVGVRGGLCRRRA